MQMPTKTATKQIVNVALHMLADQCWTRRFSLKVKEEFERKDQRDRNVGYTVVGQSTLPRTRAPAEQDKETFRESPLVSARGWERGKRRRRRHVQRSWAAGGGGGCGSEVLAAKPIRRASTKG